MLDLATKISWHWHARDVLMSSRTSWHAQYIGTGDTLCIHAGSSPPAASSLAKGPHASLFLCNSHAPQALSGWLIRNSVPKQLVRELCIEDARAHMAPQEHALQGDERCKLIEGRFCTCLDVHHGVHMVCAACNYNMHMCSWGLGASWQLSRHPVRGMCIVRGEMQNVAGAGMVGRARLI